MQIEQLALAAAFSLLVGVGLGQLFRIGSVLLVSVVALIAGAIAVVLGSSFLATAGSTICSVFCLQVGYMVGLVFRADSRRASSNRSGSKSKSEAVWH